MADQLSNDLASLRINRAAPTSGTRGGGALKTALLVVVALTLAGGTYFAGIPYLEAKVFRPEITATEIALVSPAQASVDFTSTGYVVPEKRAQVAARIQGRIARMHVKEGESVKEGQVLAELDDSDQRSRLAAARSRVSAARARVDAAKASHAEAKLQYERQKALSDQGAVAKSATEDLEAHAKVLAESVRVAEADALAAEADVRTLLAALEHTQIAAPFAGSITAKTAHEGEVVGPLGAPMFEIADFSSLIVETDVSEPRLSKVKKGGPCEIVLDAYPGRRFRCEVVEIIPKVNRAKATVPVKVKFADAVEGVFPEMAARVSFLEKELEAASMKEPAKLVVPASALAERAGAKVVFVLDGDQVRMTPVIIGPPFGAGFELKQGPSAGTKVVNNPPPALEDGRRIKEKNS